MVSIQDALEYEIKSSWWASFVFGARLQELAGSYFLWKTRRKFRRYSNILKIQQQAERDSRRRG